MKQLQKIFLLIMLNVFTHNVVQFATFETQKPWVSEIELVITISHDIIHQSIPSTNIPPG